MVMKFCLLINPSDPWRESLQNAMSLAESMISNGHLINAVLFYGRAIEIIKYPAQLKVWQHWQRSTKTPLLFCSTLLENNQLSAYANQAKGFEVVSLGSWVQAVETADKTVELN